MTIYNKQSMVQADHVREISKQLEALGSKMPSSCYDENGNFDGKEHALFNILYLACGSSAYGLTREQVASLMLEGVELDLSEFEFSKK